MNASAISLRAAVAGALALAGANAMALDPNQIDGTEVKLYISGATASDNALDNVTKLKVFCQDGTLDIYNAVTKTKVATCLANFATTGTGTNIATGTHIAVFKEYNGGSANGISYVAQSVSFISGLGSLNFIDLSPTQSLTLAANCAATSSPAATTDFGAYQIRSCTSDPALVSVVPNAGISDIDPATLFSVSGTSSGVSPTDNANLTRKRQAISVTFNPIVSTPLFSALQTAQGLSAGNTSSLDQMPTLSSKLIRGIFAGYITSGAQIYTKGVGMETAAALAALSDNNIYVCRRGNVSGTMASFKLQYLNIGCNKDPTTGYTFVTPTTGTCENGGCGWSTTTYGSDRVFAGAGSSDVRNCMDAHSSLGHYAIGVASTESKPGTTSSRFRYIKVDGQEPTIKAVMESRYDFFTENRWNDRMSSTTTNVYKLWNRIYTLVGTGTVLAAVNTPWRDGAAISGAYDGDADVGMLDRTDISAGRGASFPVLDSALRVDPVGSSSRTVPSKTSNNCNHPVQQFPL